MFDIARASFDFLPRNMFERGILFLFFKLSSITKDVSRISKNCNLSLYGETNDMFTDLFWDFFTLAIHWHAGFVRTGIKI